MSSSSGTAKRRRANKKKRDKKADTLRRKTELLARSLSRRNGR